MTQKVEKMCGKKVHYLQRGLPIFSQKFFERTRGVGTKILDIMPFSIEVLSRNFLKMLVFSIRIHAM